MKHSLDLTGLSARNRRIMALGVRGGEGDTPTPTEALLARCEATDDLEDDDLVTLHDELIEALAQVPDNELETLGQVADAIEGVRTTYIERAQAAQDQADAAAAIRLRVLGEASAEGEGEGEAESEGEGESEGEAEGGESEGEAESEGEGEAESTEGAEGGEGEGAPQAIAASTRRPAIANARRPAATRPRPRAAAIPQMQLRASANVPGVEAGQDLTRPEDLAQAVGQMVRATEGYRGPRTQLSIARLGAWHPIEVYGESRTLTRDAVANEERINAFTDFHREDARAMLAASGGNCAPPQVNYDFPVLGTDERPFRDSALARFGADRGGIRTFPPAMLSDVTGAVAAWTQTNDITPGSDGSATKACLTLDCPDETETLVDAITRCLKIGNFRQRFFPEQIAMWMTKVAQYQARFAETRAITQVGAGSTQVSAGTVLGTTRDVLAVLDRAAAAMRSRHRLPQNFPLRAAFPDWLLDNMRVDLSREQPGATDERLAMSEAQIQAFFTMRNISVTWFIDGESGQVFGNQSDGALLAWPSHVIGYLYPEGSWLFLDGGMIDFGIVRDSTLNSTNDFQWFAETLEQTHFHGYESLRLDIDICPNGATAAASAITPCTIGS